MLRSLIHGTAVAALAASPCTAQTEYERTTAQEIVAELKKVVPNGWQVTLNHWAKESEYFDPSRTTLEVWRTEKVVCYGVSIPNPPPMSRDEIAAELARDSIPIRFSFNFHLMEYLSPEGHAAQKAKNLAEYQRIKEMDAALYEIANHNAFRRYSPRAYKPRNAEEKKKVQELVDAYKAMKEARIDQDCHYKKLSFDFRDQRTWRAIKSDEVHAESEVVLNKIKTVLTFYEVDDKPVIPEGLIAEIEAVLPEGWEVGINQLRLKDYNNPYNRDDFNIEIWRKEKALYSDRIRTRPKKPDNKDGGVANAFGGQVDWEREWEQREAEHKAMLKKMTAEQRQYYEDEMNGRYHPKFNFQLVKYISPEEHARFTAENEALAKKTRAMREALSDIDHEIKGRANTDNPWVVHHPKTAEEERRVKKYQYHLRNQPRRFLDAECYAGKSSYRFMDDREWNTPDSDAVHAECDAVLAKLRTVFTFYEGKEPDK